MSADALLRAVLADPAADLPRVVYADWLDEHGQPARAEFIRVQCELAALDEAEPRRPALEDREHDLLSEHEPAWLGDAGGLHEWDWRRGFVDQVTVDSFAEPLAGVGDRHPIARLSVADVAGGPDRLLANTADWLARVSRLDQSGVGGFALADYRLALLADVLPAVADLDLSDVPGIGRLAAALDGLPLARRLTRLAFGGRSGRNFRQWDAANETLDADALRAALADARLEALATFDCGLTDDGLRVLLNGPWADTLTALDVSDNPLSFAALRAFRDAPAGLRLERLDASGTALNGGAALALVLASPACERLTDLSANGAGGWPGDAIAGSPYWSQAARLRLHSAGLYPEDLAPLCRSAGPPALRLLDLADNSLGPAGAARLADAPWLGGLTWLALSRNGLDDAAVGRLAGCGRLANLRTLHLAFHEATDGGPGITDAGAEALAAAPSLSRLRILTLSYTGVTDRGVDVLVNGPHWRLAGLGVGGCDLSADAVRVLAGSPRLARFQWLDLSQNPRLSGHALMPLAESPYLSRLCELDIGGVYADGAVRQALRGRLGRRLSE